MLDPKMERIRAVPMFAEASEDTLIMLAGAADEVTVAPGTTLISQGHLSHETYVIEQGEVQILVDDEAVATAGAGEIIGDLLVGHPRYEGDMTETGGVYLLSGPADGADITPVTTWAGRGFSDSYLGAAVAGAGDVDGDGDQVRQDARWPVRV